MNFPHKLSSVICAFLGLLYMGQASAMRTAPIPVKPLVIGGIKYTSPIEDGKEEKLQAWDEKTGKKIWELVLFTNKPAPGLAFYGTFVKELSAFRDKLIAEDEAGRCFLVDLKTRAITRTVRFREFNFSDYSVFPKNWDEKANPVLAGSISNDAGWQQYFGPAAFMGNKKPFAPDAKTWNTETLHFASIIAPSHTALTLENVALDEATKTITISYTSPKTTITKSGATYKSVAGCLVANQTGMKVTFVHNGKSVAPSSPAKE